MTCQWRIQTFHLGGGAHEMRLNAKGTVGSIGRRILIYNKIITRKKTTKLGAAMPLGSP